MHVVFAHKSFPAQFGAFGAWLSSQGWRVTFLTEDETAKPPGGCQMVHTPKPAEQARDLSVNARAFEIATLNSQAFGSAALSMRKDHGITPDLVVAHSGLGVGLFTKAVWPEAAYVPYVEWFYRYPHVDRTEDEKPMAVEDARALAQSRNVPTLLDLAIGDAVLCPTRFQAAQFPAHMSQRFSILHDGVDCARIKPDPDARMDINGLDLPADAEILTYATRGMELHRGFPQFMRAVERLQKARPHLHAVIGGEDRVAYGAQLKGGETWKSRMLKDLDLDLSRVHFTGPLQRRPFLRLLQASHVHAYFTVPFVLSWSLIEAMAAGCTIVASDVAPVREALEDGAGARLVDHDDTDATVDAISRLLDSPDARLQLARSARASAMSRYDSGWLWPARAAMLADVVRNSGRF